MQILSQKDMQTRSISERLLPKASGRKENNDHLLHNYNSSNSEFDPLFINNENSSVQDEESVKIISVNNLDARLIGVKNYEKSYVNNENLNTINANNKTLKTHLSNSEINDNLIKSKQAEICENSIKFELEGISNKNSEAKYKQNLKLRKKLPKKSSREHSTPSRLNVELGEK